MTPIHTLSDTELNELIAKATGWIHYPSDNYTTYKWVLRKDGAITKGLFRCPDFTHDSGLAMALLEEMAKYDGDDGELAPSINYLVGNQSWEIHIYKHDWIEAKDLKRAISEAYAEWKGL